MSTVTISPKYQVVIPKAIRDQLGLRPVSDLRGFLPDIDTDVDREDDRT